MIYCAAGWVRVVYEDQGPPFVLSVGDCVLQPPGIRHRVLEASPGMEVVEIGCPAEHETTADHDMALPTPELRPGRDFAGQRFVRHRASEATWEPWRLAGFECRDTGIGTATDGLAGVRVVRVQGDPGPGSTAVHEGELMFWFMLVGTAYLLSAGRADEPMARGAAVAVPPGTAYRLADCSPDLEFLEVTLPAALRVTASPGTAPAG